MRGPLQLLYGQACCPDLCLPVLCLPVRPYTGSATGVDVTDAPYESRAGRLTIPERAARRLSGDLLRDKEFRR